MEKISILIVDDHMLVRQTWGFVVNSDARFGVIAECANGEEAIELSRQLQPDVVIMDINLPGINGIEAIKKLKPQCARTLFIMSTVYEDDENIFESLKSGASGYLLKRTPPEKLFEAIKEVHEGGAPMSPEMARRVVQHFQQAPEPDSEVQKLTPRERDVLDQLAKGFRYKEIEDNLRISTGTLRSYIASVYQKLHVHSRTEAVVKYLNR